MYVQGTAALGNGFTSVRLSGIKEWPGGVHAGRRAEELSARAGRLLAPAILARDQHDPETLVMHIPTEMYTHVGATVLGAAHDVVCHVYGPQPLEYELEGMPAVREADYSVRSAEESDVRVLVS